jgi:hypothetical protein
MKTVEKVVHLGNGCSFFDLVTQMSRLAVGGLPLKAMATRGAIYLLFTSFSLLAQGQQGIYRGQICVGTKHPASLSQQSQVTCDLEHTKRGQRFVFVNLRDKAVFQVDGKNPKAFGSQDVVVIGTVDRKAGTIDITDIHRALPPKVTKASSVYIDCDACPRGMAAAWRGAFEALTDWGRFDILPDPAKADLILLLSANPYLGDFTTRDGPDTRPVRVDITYMNVIDPKTGESVWGGWKEWGSFLVSQATKTLIDEFRQDLKLDEASTKLEASTGGDQPLP